MSFTYNHCSLTNGVNKSPCNFLMLLSSNNLNMILKTLSENIIISHKVVCISKRNQSPDKAELVRNDN